MTERQKLLDQAEFMHVEQIACIVGLQPHIWTAGWPPINIALRLEPV
jgi:hypothetical protein